MTTSNRFSIDPDIRWYRSPVDQRLLRDLMARSDLRGWLQTLLHLGLFFTTGTLAYLVFTRANADTWYWSMPLLLLALFAHGTMGPFMGLIAVHELQHRTVFRTRWLNRFFEKVYAFISWSDYIWYQESHAIHHRATCHSRFDGEVQLPVRFSLSRWQVWLGLLGWNPANSWGRLKTTWHHARGEIHGDWYDHVLPESNQSLRFRHRNWARFLLIGHSLLAIGFIASGYWFLIIVFTIGTQYCSWLGFLCGVTQHYGMNSDVPDFRFNTRTFTCSWLPAFYYWNMQYHVEHHMYPAVPFFNLPKLRAAIEDDLPPATHGLVDTWREMLAIRSQSRADSAYRFVPELPKGASPAPTETYRSVSGSPS